MPLPRTRAVLDGFTRAAVLALVAIGCNDSGTITGPSPEANATNFAGTWTGTFQPDDPVLCVSSPASAVFYQDGATVTGSFAAAACGINGSFRGSVRDNTLTGWVNMNGCTGGAVSARAEGATISFTVAAFTKRPVTGDQEVLPGGRVTLQR